MYLKSNDVINKKSANRFYDECNLQNENSTLESQLISK